jgi:hypothetical protein
MKDVYVQNVDVLAAIITSSLLAKLPSNLGQRDE